MFDKMRARYREKMAHKKGFSSHDSYEFYTGMARKEGYEKAQSHKRKKELERIRHEAYIDGISRNPRWLRKLNKGIDALNNNIDKVVGTDKNRRRPRVF